MTEPKLEINSRCTSCDICVAICPENSIVNTDQNYYIENWSCSLCGLCISLCPVDAVIDQSKILS